MFETLQQMAKLDRGDATAMEDKGQLNYFIIMIGMYGGGTPLHILSNLKIATENMYFYASDTAKQDLQVLASFQERASRIYEENLLAYVKAVLRRSFSKPMVSAGCTDPSAWVMLTIWFPFRTSSTLSIANSKRLHPPMWQRALHTARQL